MSRFVIQLHDADVPPDLQIARDRLRGLAQNVLPAGSARSYELAFGAMIVVDHEPIRLDAEGMVIGRLFDRRTMKRVDRLPQNEVAQIIAEGASRLADRYWGPWVAILARPGKGWQIARAPLGELPCLHVKVDRHHLIGSDVDLISSTGHFHPHVDWDQIGLHLVLGDRRRRATCLADLSELPGGNSLELAGKQLKERTLWTPWTFATPGARIKDRAEAVALLQSVVSECVKARASDFAKVILLLSGGLDSSIVAASLKRANCDVTALNLVTTSASGNEQDHARRVSAWLGMPLRERVRDVGRIDVTRSSASGLPRPSVRIFRQESLRLADETACETGASAIFDGGGGDNVFCSLRSAAPLADRLLTSGPGRAAVQTALDVSRYAPAGLGPVLADAVRRIVRRGSFHLPTDQSLLTAAAGPENFLGAGHPWLAGPHGALPGSAGHIRGLVLAQTMVESIDPRSQAPQVSPLMSQPIIETCLRIPSWAWLDDGRNRAIARRAFADRLPIDTVMRRSKGTPDSFSVEIIDHHRESIRELLADGMLSKRGIVDRDAVLSLLDDPAPLRSDVVQRILQFVDCEAWARSWGSGST